MRSLVPTVGLSAAPPLPISPNMSRERSDAYQTWLLGELLVIGLLGAWLVLFVGYPELREPYDVPLFRLFLDTAIMLAAVAVAVLAGLRFTVEARGLDLLLCSGFAATAASLLAFAILPALGGGQLEDADAWAHVAGSTLALTLIAAAPVSRGRLSPRGGVVRLTLGAVGAALVGLWLGCRLLGDALPEISPQQGADQPALLTLALAVQALLTLAALVGFGLRYRSHGEDLHRWLALAATLALFAELHEVATPLFARTYVSQGDFLTLLAYALLMTGVWRAIRASEFGRAVAEERARVAREIHDGLAQYLFSITTHVTMLESGSATNDTIARLKEAALAAQQEARFAVLALSSASGTAPFDAALRRYVEVLTADGALEVELEIDPKIRLAPDEQIEIFRIVQEGLANVRKHSGARTAWVRISEEGGSRSVLVEDDGAGFEGDGNGGGQGLRNIRLRAETIGGALAIRSQPGRGTALEIVLRA
jgi:signal transduction histidine kinase